jgi:asparagine N-glycosylation enzyme membrane subunit Stt3
VRRTVLLIAAGAFFLALGLRLSNAPVVFDGDIPRISVLDDLYHFKRMAFTAAHFPRVLDLDPDRGERGAFCPWPPLYDFTAATFARVLGASTEIDVLRRVVWFPPLFTALFIAAVAGLVARRFGWEAGATIGIALSVSPPLIAESSLGDIDHHFLEASLVFAILGSVIPSVARDLAAGWRAAPPARSLANARDDVWAGVLLGLAITAALFVRPALLVPAALAFALLFLLTDGLAAAWGFGIAAFAVALYRLTRPPDYPNLEWFLGWPHAALLGAAAVASAVWFLRRRRLFALLCGAAVVFATPSAPGSILFGSEYLSGNAWFHTIVEGQPIWSGDAGWRIASLSMGAIFVWLLIAVAVRRRDLALGAIGAFAAVEFLLTLRNVRYQSVSIPLLMLAGTIYAALLPRRFRRVALLAMVIPAAIQFGMWERRPFAPVIEEREAPWIRAAAFLRHQTAGGRVLAPWSMGHTLDVIGGRPVIIDNFGMMSDETSFERAHDAFLTHDEESLWRYCRAADVRFVVLDNPVYGLQGAAATLGLDPEKFAATKLAARTWWWRAYYGRERAVRRFHLAYVDPQPSWRGTPVLRGPALMIWERNP